MPLNWDDGGVLFATWAFRTQNLQNLCKLWQNRFEKMHAVLLLRETTVSALHCRVEPDAHLVRQEKASKPIYGMCCYFKVEKADSP